MKLLLLIWTFLFGGGIALVTTLCIYTPQSVFLVLPALVVLFVWEATRFAIARRKIWVLQPNDGHFRPEVRSKLRVTVTRRSNSWDIREQLAREFSDTIRSDIRASDIVGINCPAEHGPFIPIDLMSSPLVISHDDVASLVVKQRAPVSSDTEHDEELYDLHTFGELDEKSETRSLLSQVERSNLGHHPERLLHIGNYPRFRPRVKFLTTDLLNSQREDLRKQFVEEVKTNGFAIVTERKTETTEAIKKLYECGRTFFRKRSIEKKRFSRRSYDMESTCHGYFQDGMFKRREYFEIRKHKRDTEHLWPPVDSFQENANKAFNDIETLGIGLYELLCSYVPELNIENAMDVLDQRMDPDAWVSSSCMRILRYSSASQAATTRRVKPRNMPHADIGLVTVMPKPTAGGLQLMDCETGSWIDISPHLRENDFVIVTGHSLGWLTRGYYRPLLHRVIRQPEERMSMPFFLRANPYANLHRFSRDPFVQPIVCDDEKTQQTIFQQESINVHELMSKIRLSRNQKKIPISALRWTYRVLQSYISEHYPEWEYAVTPGARV